MRYVIIPLLIILDMYWSYKSIKELHENREWPNDNAMFWAVLHTTCLVVPIFCYLIYLIFKYW